MTGKRQKILNKLLNKSVELVSTGEVTGRSADDLTEILEEYENICAEESELDREFQKDIDDLKNYKGMP